MRITAGAVALILLSAAGCASSGPPVSNTELAQAEADIRAAENATATEHARDLLDRARGDRPLFGDMQCRGELVPAGPLLRNGALGPNGPGAILGLAGVAVGDLRVVHREILVARIPFSLGEREARGRPVEWFGCQLCCSGVARVLKREASITENGRLRACRCAPDGADQ